MKGGEDREATHGQKPAPSNGWMACNRRNSFWCDPGGRAKLMATLREASLWLPPFSVDLAFAGHERRNR